MAEQDFDIKIRTTADTTGAEQTNAALKTVYNTVEQNRAKFRELEGLPPLEKKPEAKEETDKLLGHLESGFARLAIHTIGIGAVYEFINEIKKSAELISKITDSLEKQGDALVKNVQLMAEASKFAQSQADVVKIGEAGLKGVAAQHANVVELQKQELSYWQQFIDSLAKGGQIGIGPLQKALDDAVTRARDLEEEARRQTYGRELAAQLTIARREAQSFDQNVQEITDHIREQEAIQARAGPDQIEDYVNAGKAAEGYRKELADVIRLEEQRRKAAEAAAKPLTKALTTPTGAFVVEQEKAEYEHQARRAALEQKRREALATGDSERQKAIEDELGHDRFSRDQRKEQLQRYLANQESLFRAPRAEGPAEMIRDLGTLGAKKFEAAQAELDRIYAEQKGEGRQLGAGGGMSETNTILRQILELWK